VDRDAGPVHVSIVMPAYNEAPGIGAALAQVREHLEGLPDIPGWEVIVVDDGSRDDTAAVVTEVARGDGRFRLLRSLENRGKGHAVRMGMLAARGHYMGFMDADLSTDLSAIKPALAWLERGRDIVVGSRRVAGARILVPQPWPRRLASRAFRVACHWLVGLRGVQDSQCGFKFFRGAVARELFSLQTIEGFLFDVEVLALAQRRGYSLVEMPVAWTNRRQSRLRLLPMGYRVLRDLLRIRWRLARLRD